MAYPPPVPPATRTNATPMVDNHPEDHNVISAALTEVLNHIATMEQTLGPIGSVFIWPSNTPPTNSLLCQGQSLLRTDFPEIFALFGTIFGAVDGTHFNMPDYQGRVPCGVNAVGQPLSGGVGEKFGQYDGSVTSHQHVTTDHLHNQGGVATMQWGEPWQSTAQPPDNVNIFAVRIGDGITINFGKFPSASFPGAVTGQTGAADRTLATTFVGSAPTNLNIQPVLTSHFAMRVH